MIQSLVVTATLSLDPAAVPAAPPAPVELPAPAPPAVDAGTALAFGDHLYEEGDAYNALTWYRLALFLEPDRPDADALRFREAMAYEKGERYPAAVFAYGQVTGPLADHAAYRSALCEQRSGNETSARVSLERVSAYYPDSPWAPRAAYAQGVLALRRYDLAGASRTFGAFSYPADPLAPRAATLSAEAAEPLPHKRPLLAAGLSVLPGLGQLYAGHPGDAMMAALFNIPLGLGAGLLLADGVEQKRGLEIGAGAVLGGVFWFATYPSNLIGAWRGATRTNKQHERRKAEALLKEAWDPTLELDIDDVQAPEAKN
jgi:tetratricopeptide (TPR) repeat protein